jgi:hypothetical protein
MHGSGGRGRAVGWLVGPPPRDAGRSSTERELSESVSDRRRLDENRIGFVKRSHDYEEKDRTISRNVRIRVGGMADV